MSTMAALHHSSLPRLAFALLICAISACSDTSDMAELQRHIVEVTLRPGGEIEPTPTFLPYEAFTYNAAAMRSPFDIPIAVRMREAGQGEYLVRPNENRVRETLEEFALTELVMVGMLSRDNAYIGLVRDQNWLVHRVLTGAYLGRNHGRVIAVSPTQIDLVEIVPSGDGGWVERPRKLELQR
jgi:type IV pilus assembly protein PilP